MRPSLRRVSKLALTTLRSSCQSALLGSLLASMLLLPGLPLAASALEPQVRYPATLELIGKFGNRIIGEGRAFIPLWQNPDNLLYLDLRGMGDDSSNGEGNGGLSFRHMFDESWILGGYGFFDYRSTNFGENTFVGGTLGIEALSTNWDFHVNGYIPESGSKGAPAADRVVATFPTIGVREGREKALWGFDSEIGWRLPISDDSLFWDTRIYAGGYYFDNSGVKEIAGPRGRVEMRFHDPFPFLPRGSRITLGAEVQWDDPRGTQGYGSVALRIPIYNYGGSPPDGSTRLSRLQRRMLDPIQRDVDIITNVALGAVQPVFNPKTAERIDFLYYADATTNGTGSRSDPAAIQDAIDFAGGDGIVVALSKSGVIDTGLVGPDGATLQDSQILMGGGATILVKDSRGQSFPFTAEGRRATLVNPGGRIITAARNNLIDGLDFGLADFGGEGVLSNIGIFAGDPGASPLPKVFGGLMVADSRFAGIGDTGVVIGSPVTQSEGGDPDLFTWQAGIMNNQFDVDLLGIGVFASSFTVELDISGNEFTAGSAVAQAIVASTAAESSHVGVRGNVFHGYLGQDPAVLLDTDVLSTGTTRVTGNRFNGPVGGGNQAFASNASGFLNAIEFTGNRIDGYSGSCVGEDCVAAVAISAIGAGSTTDVSTNTFAAPFDEDTDTRLGLAALLVDIQSDVSTLTVATNRVSGFTGQAPDLSDGFPLGPVTNQIDLLDGAAAVTVGVSSPAGASVTVRRNTISAPEPEFGSDPVEDVLPFFTGPGLRVRVEGTSLSAGGPEGSPEGGEEAADPDIVIASNIVRDYTGLPQVYEIGEMGAPNSFSPGAVAAVEIETVGPLDADVTGNVITAREFQTLTTREDLTNPRGPGLAIQASNLGSRTLNVSGNRVEDFATVQFADANAEAVGGVPAAVEISATSVGFDAVDVNVSDNSVLSTQFPGGTGLRVDLAGFAATTTLEGNRIEGYLGLPQPVVDGLGDAVAEGDTGLDGVGAALEVVSNAVLLDLDVVDNQVRGIRQNVPGGTQPIGASALYVAASGAVDADVSIQDNVFNGFFGLAEIGYGTGAASTAVNAAVSVSAIDAGAVDIAIQRNRVSAPPISVLEGIPGGAPDASGVGISVLASAASGIEVDVSSNDVDGYAADVDPAFLAPPDGAIVVSTFTLGEGTSEDFVSNRVTVDNNSVRAPDLAGESSQAGISVSARDNFVGGPVLFTQALVDVTNNDVVGYTGTAEVGAVEVNAEAYLLVDSNAPGIVVDRNRVTAPRSGGARGIDVDANGFFVSVDVADNDVDGYGSASGLSEPEPEPEPEGEGVNGGGIRVDASASFAASNQAQANVRVADNTVRAPDDAGGGTTTACGGVPVRGPLGIEVCNTSNLGQTVVAGNQVFDYESGIFVRGLQDTVDIEVTNNRVNAASGATGTGIDVDAGGFIAFPAATGFASAEIQDNQVSGGGVGISANVLGFGTRNDLVIANNRVDDSQNVGIEAVSFGTTDATIAGNDVDVDREPGAKGILLDILIANLDLDSVLNGDLLDNIVDVAMEGDELVVDDADGVISGEILLNGVLICLPAGLPCD